MKIIIEEDGRQIVELRLTLRKLDLSKVKIYCSQADYTTRTRETAEFYPVSDIEITPAE